MNTTNLPADLAPAFKAIASRMDRAVVDFVAVLMERGDIDEAAARRVLAYYRKIRVIKSDAVGGTIRVKHGALLDRDVIQRAATAK